ncbi:hypothetical protein NQZ68_013598 [Dissostichus eleginoides]|nr:hypothetical protein NQZ68_013598 [Dissostichus eleginoides]
MDEASLLIHRSEVEERRAAGGLSARVKTTTGIGQQMGAVCSILALKNPAIKHSTDGTFSIFQPALIKQPNNI